MNSSVNYLFLPIQCNTIQEEEDQNNEVLSLFGIRKCEEKSNGMK